MEHLLQPIFDVTDPRGYKIQCIREQWLFHVVSNRNFMNSDFWIEEASKAVSGPLEIYQDRDFADRENYYRLLPPQRGRQRYMKVVVVVNRVRMTGIVKTAMIADSPKRTEELIWPIPGN